MTSSIVRLRRKGYVIFKMILKEIFAIISRSMCKTEAIKLLIMMLHYLPNSNPVYKVYTTPGHPRPSLLKMSNR